MKINLSDFLTRAAKLIGKHKGFGKSYEDQLLQLNDHLKEVREKWKAGDRLIVDEFFELYV